MEETIKFNGKVVFFVEDDMFFAKIISRHITQAGGKVIHAINGQEALTKILESTPDIIVLDLMLPGGVDGFEVLEKVKQDPKTKDLPVVIVSNLDQPADIDRGLKLGAYRFLVKASVTPPEIIEQIYSALTSNIK